MEKVFVLGSRHQRAEDSFKWESSFPNFSNADALIINLQSLNRGTISTIGMEDRLYNEVRKQVFDMLMTGEKSVIVVMSSESTNLKWLPIYPIYRSTAPARVGLQPRSEIMSNYLKNVEKCSYYFHAVNADYFITKTDPKSADAETYKFTYDASLKFELETYLEDKIENVAKQVIGGSFKVNISYGIGGTRESFKGQHTSGPTMFLPPCTKKNPEEAIDLLLDSLIHPEDGEPIAPDWDGTIKMPTLSTYQGQLKELQRKTADLHRQAAKVNEEIKRISRLRSLLWAEGRYLEETVRDAFKILGFQEIRKVRAENLEDWIIDFKHLDEFAHAVLEIKSSEKRTSMADLTQCNKWVEDYWLDGKRVKGVFVANQHRMSDISKSGKKREEFSPSEKEYADKRQICILPTNQLFKTVIKKMKTGNEPKRAELEKKIAETNGLWTL